MRTAAPPTTQFDDPGFDVDWGAKRAAMRSTRTIL
jgi:hypothetical protein